MKGAQDGPKDNRGMHPRMPTGLCSPGVMSGRKIFVGWTPRHSGTYNKNQQISFRIETQIEKGGWEGVLRQACRQEQNHKERRDKLAHRHEEREARLETIGVMLAQVASKASIDSGE